MSIQTRRETRVVHGEVQLSPPALVLDECFHCRPPLCGVVDKVHGVARRAHVAHALFGWQAVGMTHVRSRSEEASGIGWSVCARNQTVCAGQSDQITRFRASAVGGRQEHGRHRALSCGRPASGTVRRRRCPLSDRTCPRVQGRRGLSAICAQCAADQAHGSGVRARLGRGRPNDSRGAETPCRERLYLVC